MKVKSLIVALISIPLLNFAMGHRYETVNPSKQTLKAAQSAGKFVLVITEPEADMAADILSNRHTSRFLNKHFIIEHQLNHDTPGAYLIYNAQGELVHRVAHEAYPYELAVKIKRSLNPETQYYPALTRYENGDRSAAILERLITSASDAGDHENVGRFIQAYLETGVSVTSEEAIRLWAKHTTASTDPGFGILMADIAAADEVLGMGKTGEKLASIIFNETFTPYLKEKDVDLDWITNEVKSKYPNSGIDHLIDGMPIQFLEIQHDWIKLEPALSAYLETHGNQLTEAQKDYYAWLSTECLNNSQQHIAISN